MPAGVVSVGRHKYAVGLYWENSPGGGRVGQIAKEAASQPGQQAEFYAIRPGNKNGRIPQFGLSPANAGQKPGMPVLAGCLASQIPGSWAGAFRLSEGIAVIIVRDDLIVPDGDFFFLDEIEARDRLIQEIGFGGLQTIYAPEAWSVSGADTIPLTLLLNDRRDIKLQQVHIPQKTKMIVMAAACAFFLLLVGVWYWQDQVDKENAERAQHEETIRRAQALAKSMLPAVIQHEDVPLPHYDRKWETLPTALSVIESCQHGLAQVPGALAGWRLTTLKCSTSGMNLAFSREKGSAIVPEGFVINDGASAATRTIVLPPLQPRGPESLLDQDEVTARYLAENWSATLARAPDDPLPPPPAGYTGQWAPPPAPWVKRSFTLSVPELPAQLPDILHGLPGAVITSLSFTPSGVAGNWTVEGVIYENRK